MSNISKIKVGETTYDLKDLNAMTYADNGVLGAKNLLKNKAISQTINGVTFTVNADGTISLNGTASDNTFMSISDWFDLPAGNYILNGSATDKIYIYIQKQTSGGTETIAQCFVAYPGGVSFNWDGSAKVRVRIVVENGQNTNDKTIYPMIRLASDPDDTYVPYAMTNRELTEEFTVQESAVTDVVATTVNKNKLFKYGKVVQLMLDLSGVTIAENGVIAKVPLDFRPIEQIMISVRQSSGSLFCNVMGGGDIKPIGSLSNTNCQLYATWITN